MAETQNEQQTHSFKRKLGNTTYTVKVHFSKDTDKTFKDRVQKLIIKECLEESEIVHINTLHLLSEVMQYENFRDLSSLIFLMNRSNSLKLIYCSPFSK